MGRGGGGGLGPSEPSPATSPVSDPTSVFPASSERKTFPPCLLRSLKQNLDPAEKERGRLALAHPAVTVPSHVFPTGTGLRRKF